MKHLSEGLRFAYLLTEKILKENTQNIGALFEGTSALIMLVSSLKFEPPNKGKGGSGELAFSCGTSNPHGRRAQKPPS